MARPWAVALLLAAAGLVVILPLETLGNVLAAEVLWATRIVTVVGLLAGGLAAPAAIRPAVRALLIAALALNASSLTGDLGLRWLDLELDSAAGLAVARLTNAVTVVGTILVAAWLLRIPLASLYLQPGRLRLGLAIGLGVFVLLALVAVYLAGGEGVAVADITSVGVYILVFVLANALLEELLYRGLFLRVYEPLVGPGLALLVTAVVFTLMHAQVNYADDNLVFLAIVFPLALLFGWLAQRTESLLSPILVHAGADLLLVTSIFAAYGTAW